MNRRAFLNDGKHYQGYDFKVRKQKPASTKHLEGHFQPKHEKLWVVSYGRVRRHSRLLYIGLDPEVVRLHDIQLGDTIKFMLFELIKSPRDEESAESES